MPSLAQIVPDATLPNNTTVIINGNRFTIDGETTIGDNLFHSWIFLCPHSQKHSLITQLISLILSTELRAVILEILMD